MAKIGKKKLKEIQMLSFITDILDSHFHDRRDENGNNQIIAEGKSFVHTPPEDWNKSETELFDALTDLEYKLKDKVIEILGGENE